MAPKWIYQSQDRLYNQSYKLIRFDLMFNLSNILFVNVNKDGMKIAFKANKGYNYRKQKNTFILNNRISFAIELRTNVFSPR